MELLTCEVVPPSPNLPTSTLTHPKFSPPNPINPLLINLTKDPLSLIEFFLILIKTQSPVGSAQLFNPFVVHA